MNALIPKSFGAVSSEFANTPKESLGDGIISGYTVIGYKGSKWSLRKSGETTLLMRPDGDGPMNSLEVVVLKASSSLSKIYYPHGYKEGSKDAPDCFSTNGVTPSSNAKNKQCATCAACKHNQWGSRITESGKQGKSCQDSKRLAVVPLYDLHNEVWGGPMLLRVPAASLGELKKFGETMEQLGYQYFTYGTRVSFDLNVAHPKFVYSAIRPLTDDEARIVKQLRDDPAVARVLAEDVGTQEEAQPSVQTPSPFEQPPAQTHHTTGAASSPPAPAVATPTTAHSHSAAHATHQSHSTTSTNGSGTMASPAGGAEHASFSSDQVASATTGVPGFDDALDKLLG